MTGHLTGCLQVDRLAADHAHGPGRVAHQTQHAKLARDERRIVARRFARQQRERLRVQAVAREDGDPFAVHDVQRRLAAAQRVVVHRGQVVVDERIGMDHLDRAGGRQREIDSRRSGHGVGRRKREDRPQTFAAGEHAVPHRVGDDRRAVRRLAKIALERLVDAHADALEERGERFGGHEVSRGRGRRHRATRAPASARRVR